MVELLSKLSLENVLLKELNECLQCNLCEGYYVQPVVLQECHHTFCYTCILNHFQDELECPECGILTHPTEPEKCLLHDEILSQLVNELVPGLAESVQKEKMKYAEKARIPQFLIRLMPSDRRSEPLIRPYFLLSGNTPLRVISSLAGGPRYIHFRDSRIKKFQITISDWLKAEHSASYQDQIENFDDQKEPITLTLRFTS